MEGLSGTLAGCRAGMRLGLAQLQREGAGGTDGGAGLGWWSALVSPKIYRAVGGESMKRLPLTDRRVVWTGGLSRETVGQVHARWLGLRASLWRCP